MDIPSIKTLFVIFSMLLKCLKSFVPKIMNLLLRPNIRVELKPHIIQLTFNNTQALAQCVSIILTPASDIKIKANSIQINNENYTSLYQGLLALSNKNNNSEVLSYFKDNWLDITQGIKFIEAKKGQPLIIPLSLVGEYSHFLTALPKKTYLFNSEKKLSILLGIDGKTFCYGLDLTKTYHKAINHLAFRLQDIKTLKEEYKELVV